MNRQIDLSLEDLKARGNLRILPRETFLGHYIQRGEKRLLNLSSNDYLGIGTDKDLQREFLRHVDVECYPLSATSSRLLTGNYPIYNELEEMLASMYQAEDALVVGSGYHANSGIICTLADRNTLILADKLVHASMIDGIRLSDGKCIRYRHNDLSQLERLIERYQSQYEKIVIMTESIFSMDGDCCDLEQLVAIKHRHKNVVLYVDEAHAVGVRGEGCGLAKELGIHQHIDFLIGTLGKAWGSVGAYVICTKKNKQYLVNRLRTLIFSTALPPLNIAWTKFVMERNNLFSGRRCHLNTLIQLCRDTLGDFVESQIIPIVIGENDAAIALAQNLCECGFYVLPIRPPTVPKGTSRIRLSLTASIKPEEMKDLLRCITQRICINP